MAEALGCSDGVLVIDETGFVKKGRHSVGVGRQYSGTTGRTLNSQIGAFVFYASRFGQALIDRQLYLPKNWAADEVLRNKTHVPGDITFATKPAMARDMIARTLDAGLPKGWRVRLGPGRALEPPAATFLKEDGLIKPIP